MNSESWIEKKKVINHYNNFADSYDRLYGREQKIKIEKALKNLMFKQSDKVLDLGCGSGILFSYLENSVDLLIGLDHTVRHVRFPRHPGFPVNADEWHPLYLPIFS